MAVKKQILKVYKPKENLKHSEVELICAIGKENCNYKYKDILTCKFMRKCINCVN